MKVFRRHPLRFSRAGLVILLSGSCAVVASAQQPRGKEEYDKKVLPMLTEYCYDCHGDGMDKGNFALDKNTDYSAILGDRKLWDSVREHVTTHVMPPENKPIPTNEVRDQLIRWIDDQVFWVDPAKPDPGHVTLRRLNRVEYNNTVRDVFGVDSRPASSFPPDDTGYGYDNIGDVLSLSPLLMEKYMKAARKVADEAVWLKPPGVYKEERSGDGLKVTEGQGGDLNGATALFTNGKITTRVNVKEEGVYRLILNVSATQSGPEKAKFAVKVDGNDVREGEVTAEYHADKPDENWQRVSLDVPVKKGDCKITVAFLNDFGDPNAAEEHRRDRNLLVQNVVLQGPIKFRGQWQSKFVNWLVDGKALAAQQMVLEANAFESSMPVNDFYDDGLMMIASGSMEREINIPFEGEYRIMVVASADQVGGEGAKFTVRMGDKDLATKEVTAKTGVQQTISFKTPLTPGLRPLKLSFINDSYSKETGDRNLTVHRVIVQGPLNNQPVNLLSDEEIPKWTAKMGLKIFRRPLDPVDLEKLVGLAKMASKDGADLEETLSVVTEAMLCSPKFLFRGGAEPEGKVENDAVLVDEFTLASRLSYFLWSSAPDDELLRLASAGELRKNLRAQVTRMIGDWKGWALAENFAGQWLRLRDVELVAPNRRLFPEFEGRLAYDMKTESLMFFDHIYRGNRSVLEFLDSDYSFMNENLAKFYGIKEDVKGKQFRKVSLEGTPRGGILTQAGVLTLTSHPNRTSPVKRGQFILENILGTPPPPAPQNVPAFGEDRGAKVTGTLRQRFEAHRSNPACASCHAFLDPMGFALENYDAIGRWRDTDNKQPIDATGKLLTGQAFNGAAELRKVLVANKKNDFTRCLVENLLIYSLGRGLDYPDKYFVKQLTKQAEERGYKFQDIVVAVVESVPFQKMRASEAGKTANQ